MGGSDIMKATGVVRRMDGLGRIVIPKEIRKTFDIDRNQGLEIFVDGQDIIISKYFEKCIFCGGMDELTPFDEKLICYDCIDRIGQVRRVVS